MASLISALITLLTFAILARVIFDWLIVGGIIRHDSPIRPIRDAVVMVTEPILAPIRKVVHRGGPFDFSPMVAILFLTMIAAVLAERVEGATYKTLYLLERGAVLAAHRQTLLSPAELAAGFAAGTTAAPVVETIVGNLGLLSSAEGLAPELARALKLDGAELLLWCAGDIGAPLRTLTRARAHENRLYVAAAGDTQASGGGYVVDPAGGVIAETLEGEAMAAGADINRLFARWNDMAPGTNPLRDAPPGLLPR